MTLKHPPALFLNVFSHTSFHTVYLIKPPYWGHFWENNDHFFLSQYTPRMFSTYHRMGNVSAGYLHRALSGANSISSQLIEQFAQQLSPIGHQLMSIANPQATRSFWEAVAATRGCIAALMIRTVCQRPFHWLIFIIRKNMLCSDCSFNPLQTLKHMKSIPAVSCVFVLTFALMIFVFVIQDHRLGTHEWTEEAYNEEQVRRKRW